MNKQLSIAVSIVLIFTGVVTLVFILAGSVFNFRIRQLWPLTIVVSGLLFVLPPLLVRGKRGLGGLFIPGIPVLTTGTILLFASVFRQWNAWAWLWPTRPKKCVERRTTLPA